MTPLKRFLLRLLTLGVVAGLIVADARPVSSQTRADEIARQQQAKAENAKPDVPSRAERFFDQFEQGKWFVGQPKGWYPAFGSIYEGGGLAGGAGYRRYIGYDSFVDVQAMYSIASYKQVKIVGSTPNHLHDRLDLSGTIAWLDATRVPFYGLGNDSALDDRTNFRLNRTQVSGAATLHLVDWLRLTLDGGVDDYRQKAGQGRFRSIEEVFTPDTAPLLGRSPALSPRRIVGHRLVDADARLQPARRPRAVRLRRVRPAPGRERHLRHRAHRSRATPAHPARDLGGVVAGRSESVRARPTRRRIS